MAIEKVKKYNMENRVQEFEVSSAMVELAAEALHCGPCRIAKTKGKTNRASGRSR